MTDILEHTFAFVLMPFSSEFDDIYRLGVKEPAATLGIRAERVDDQIFVEGILERIYRQIDVADIIIADMSDQNPNVFYEVGYAHAKGKLCLLLTNDASHIPFDLKHKRHIVYGHSIRRLRELLTRDLQWAQQEIDKLRRSQIRVESKINGYLEKTQWSATAKITFVVDLYNDSDTPSSDIEGAYYYTGNDWEIRQDDKECSTTESDFAPYRHRYFLNCPVKRLQRGAWAQLRFAARRRVAVAYRGEELKDSYWVAGHSMLRLVTDKDRFDYDVPVDIVVDDIPF